MQPVNSYLTRWAAFVLLLFINKAVGAQELPPLVEEGKAPVLSFHSGKAFYKDIQDFKAADSVKMPPANAILLIGSSSFTYWRDVSAYFPGYTILNRGFGGSTLSDLIRYQDFIIYPYKPKQVLIYCGENDFASSDSVDVTMVVNRFKQLFWDIRVRLPKVPISYVAMKPSPSRYRLLPKYIEGNRQIRAFLATQKLTSFIDVFPAMLGPDGRPIGKLFTADSLHMNAEGYAIWQKIIRPYLKKGN